MTTESTKQRLIELENKRKVLSKNIMIEQSKKRLKPTKEDIIKHVSNSENIIKYVATTLAKHHNNFWFCQPKSPIMQ